jgi:Rrf2 family protein
MLGLSQTAGYAVYALSCLSTDRPLLIRQVAVQTGIQKPYLAKIINQLTNKNLVITKRGYRGGICLARPARSINLLEIVVAIEGEGWASDCLLGLRECNSQHVCPTHDLWVGIKDTIRKTLQEIVLSDIAAAGIAHADKRSVARCRQNPLPANEPNMGFAVPVPSKPKPGKNHGV